MNQTITRTFTIILGALLSATISANVHASTENQVAVTIDNKYIQTYNETIGRWVEVAGQSLGTLARQNGTTVEEILKVNNRDVSRDYIFVPMSQGHYKDLIRRGYGRRIFHLDSRKLMWPVELPNYTSRYGQRFGGMHHGLDLAAPRKTIVIASREGTVVQTGWYGGLGYAVSIRHDDGIETVYAHNTTILVRDGDKVRQGQAIALSGSTGRSTGPHVHFEVRYMGVSMNPEDFIQYGLTRPDVVLKEQLTDPDTQTTSIDVEVP
jgi:murein DD-endopeptidase MepM/ murein hydrolase activator NlpD